MRTNNGAFIISRTIYDSDIWSRPADWIKIWIYLLGNVNFQDNHQFKRGQDFFQYDTIARANGVSYKTVENCMKYLRDRNQIGITRTSRGAIISITNYDTYQELSNYKETERKQKGNRKESSSDSIIEEGKKEINKEDTTTTIAVLDFFNSTTGTKLKLTDNKKKQIKARLNTFSIEELQTAIKNRMKSQWHIENGWTKDWDSLFCNDDKIDKMLNNAQQSSSLYTDEEMEARIERANIYN